jgi:hypothetical protein
MGLYIRKSLRVGPVRFNLSKSGIGMSAGIKGLRLGTGPRGNYVHMGRGGLYFRHSLASRNDAALPSSTRRPFPVSEAGVSVGPMEEIESGSVLQMTDGSSGELLSELNEKKKKARLLPMAIALCIAAFLALSAASPSGWLVYAGIVLSVGICWVASTQDAMRKTTVIFYNMDPDAERAYGALHDAFDQMKSCGRAWHLAARGNVLDRKYHAGAAAVVKRGHITLKCGEPPMVKANIDVPLIPAGRQMLAFMPDRLLVFDNVGVGAIGYQELRIECAETRFIEDEALAGDATVVGKTWQYVNKKGGPDRRFKNNRELPICIYDQVSISSSSGVNEIIQLSRRGVSNAFAAAVSGMVKLQATEAKQPPDTELAPAAPGRT